MDADSRVLLIDGMAIAYRAFHAIRGLETSDGRPTNALFGFIRMTKQLRKQWKPTHEIVVFDGGLPKERLALLPSYKAQREEMPDALREQLSAINEYLAAARVPALRIEGEEADDVMATLTERSIKQGAEVLIATSDKDMFQLVGDRVWIVPPAKSEERMGAAEILEKTGVRPEQVVDWLSLVGDSADNIPGVPGIGNKTAAKLLQTYGSLDAIYAHIDSVEPERIRRALLDHRETVERNIGMTRLRSTMDLPVADGAVQPPDIGHLLAFYRSMQLHGLAAEVEEGDLLFEF